MHLVRDEMYGVSSSTPASGVSYHMQDCLFFSLRGVLLHSIVSYHTHDEVYAANRPDPGRTL